MKNKILNIVQILLMMIVVSSCTEIIDNSSLPYTEQIVIRGVLVAGQPIRNISVIHSLPALDSFDMNKAMINDAVVTITIDNIKHTLINKGQGLYDADSLIAQSGKSYILEVKWQGRSCNAITSVPYPVDIIKVVKAPINKNFRTQLWRVGLDGRAKIPAEVACVGGAELVDSLGIEPMIRKYVSRVYREQDTGKTGLTAISVFTTDVQDTNNIVYTTGSYKLNLFVEAYDIQFFDYFKTRSNGESIASLFGFTSSEVTWNIKGDGIGLFIGMARSSMRYY